MEDEKIVFVLGAGASHHFGYPLGSQLIEAMDFFVRRLPSAGNNYASKNDADDFIRTVKEFNPLNTDYFLHNNRKYKDVAYKVIEDTLKNIESDASYTYTKDKIQIWCEDVPGADSTKDLIKKRPDLEKYSYDARNWVKFIHHYLVAGARSGSEIDDVKRALSKISVITFNYDLSFEKALFNYFDKSSIFKPVANYLTDNHGFFRKNIRHVYGRISDNNIYNKKSTTSNLRIISPEKSYNIDKIAKCMLSKATRIYFLGYGFDSFNNKKIGLDSVLMSSNNLRNIFYTNYGDCLIPDSMVRSFLNDGKRSFESFGADTRIKQAFRKKQDGQYCSRTKIDIIKSQRNVYDALEKDLLLPIL